MGKRRREVVELLGEGYSRWQVAKRLGISVATVRSYEDAVRRSERDRPTARSASFPLVYELARDPDFALARWRATVRALRAWEHTGRGRGRLR